MQGPVWETKFFVRPVPFGSHVNSDLAAEVSLRCGIVDHDRTMEQRPVTSKEKMDRLRSALLEEQSEASRNLIRRLDSCGVDWKDGRYSCRSPACSSCRRTYIRAEQRKTRNFFIDASNHDLAFATVVLGGSRDLDEVGTLIERGYRATRNRVNAERRMSARWSGLSVRGWYEVDAIGPEHYGQVLPKRRALLDEIAPMYDGQNGPTWVPTFHAIIRLNGIDYGQVQASFAQQWSAPAQVHIEPLNAYKSVDENIDAIVGYSNKHKSEIKLENPNRSSSIIVPWSSSWSVSYYGWLGLKRNGFEFLRFSIGPKHKDHQKIVEQNVIELLPMLYEFNTFPMLY